MKPLRVLFTAAILIAVQHSLAQIPHTLTYQGLLTDTLGTPLPDASYNLTFSLYQTSTGGSALWQEVRTLQTKRGFFSTNLGEVNPLLLPFDQQYWLGIQIGGDPELMPRMKLTASGYSLRAQKADTAAYALTAPQQGFVDSARVAGTIPDNSVSTSKLLDGAVTSAKIPDGTISTADIADNAVTTSKIGDAAITTPKISTSGASSGQSLVYNGTSLGWGNPNATLGLPYAGTASSAGGEMGALAVRNFATGLNENGIFGLTWSDLGSGVYGTANSPAGLSNGVYGKSSSSSGLGVWGDASAATGYTAGVLGGSNSTNGAGVSGSATASSGPTTGVSGFSYSPDGVGVYGQHVPASGTRAGVEGVTNSVSGEAVGVLGVVSSTSPGGSSAAVRGINNGTGPAGIGVWGSQAGTGYGVYGASVQGTGVVGITTSSPSTGVYGGSPSNGVLGEHTLTSAPGYGVIGRTYSTNLGVGVYGEATGTSGSGVGVWGRTNNNNTADVPAAVYGQAAGSSGIGVWGVATLYSAIWGQGNIACSGNKYFQIDHPLDPANKFLYHACTEGPEPLNVYSGNITLDAHGEAWIDLPSYFQEINRDYRYQLTPIGVPSALYVAEEIRNNRFKVAGGHAGMKVSWRVEAVRNDRYVQRYGKPVEEEKPASMRGKYFHPELYGQPEELTIRPASSMERAEVLRPVVPVGDSRATILPQPKDLLLERSAQSTRDAQLPKGKERDQ